MKRANIREIPEARQGEIFSASRSLRQSFPLAPFSLYPTQKRSPEGLDRATMQTWPKKISTLIGLPRTYT